jgi:thiamine biosynthesis lipoprotein
MGTRVSMNVFVGVGSPAAAGEAMQSAFDEMARIETLMSEWQPHSELSRLNDAAATGMAGPMKVSAELFEVLQRAAEISRASEGAFDITFHGVGQLWSFKPGSRPPTREAVREKLPLVDWSQIELDATSTTVLLHRPGMKIGLGAIAKGYAVDRASAVLRAADYSNHIVEAGGDTFVSGSKGDDSWVVGVQAPNRGGTIGALPIRDRAVVTSGDYQRFFEFEGKRYAHILDPRTGWPIEREDSPKSVTLVAADTTVADAYCTAVAVMGVEGGLAFVETRPELEVIFIRQDNTVAISSGLRDIYMANDAGQSAGQSTSK